MSIAMALPALEMDVPLPEGSLAEFLQTAEERRAQLLQVARRITNCSEDAEDIVQEAYLKAYRALPRFRGEALMSTWLTAIVRNTALEYLRGQRGRVLVSIEYVSSEDNDVIEMDLRDPGQNPEEACGRRQIEELVRGEVDGLGAVCRRSIELCILEEMPQIEVADALQISVATVKSRVFRGKRMLRRAISMHTKRWAGFSAME
jgi:RNA polymerase sigma-70 factor (ECF subfamily)